MTQEEALKKYAEETREAFLQTLRKRTPQKGVLAGPLKKLQQQNKEKV